MPWEPDGGLLQAGRQHGLPHLLRARPWEGPRASEGKTVQKQGGEGTTKCILFINIVPRFTMRCHSWGRLWTIWLSFPNTLNWSPIITCLRLLRYPNNKFLTVLHENLLSTSYHLWTSNLHLSIPAKAIHESHPSLCDLCRPGRMSDQHLWDGTNCLPEMSLMHNIWSLGGDLRHHQPHRHCQPHPRLQKEDKRGWGVPNPGDF